MVLTKGLTLFSAPAGRTGLIAAILLLSPGVGVAAPHQGPALPPSGSDSLIAGPMAQASSEAPRGCRITRAQIGIYQEPNLNEAALGILTAEQTVTLGDGSGSGWARITAPQTGWVQAKFLRGDRNTPCPAGMAPPSPSPVPAPVAAPVTEPMASSGGVSRAVCQVKPEGGLILRDQPRLDNSRILGTIRPGNYTFQFTERRTTSPDPSGDRLWVYITAPAKGWISTGFASGGSNLAGAGCN